MVPRYSRPEMTAIWTPENRFRIWFEIEAHATDALAELGVVPKEAAQALWTWWNTNPAIDVAAIDAIEAVTKHDVIAFLTWVADNVGDQARFMHQGMTSSDVLDTALAVQLAQASDILLADLDRLLDVLKRRAIEHKMTPTIGRSHGIHAEPVTFGLKLAQAYAEFDRCKTRLIAARADIATCAISGAVGTFANIDPSVRSMSPPSSACRSSRFRHRSSRVIATRCISRPWASSPARSSGSRSKCATSSAPKYWKRKNISRPAKRGRRRCRTSATRC